MIEDETAEAAIKTINGIVGSLEQSQKIMEIFREDHQKLVEHVFLMEDEIKKLSLKIESLIGEKTHASH
jgi:hypothetical protein